MSGEKRRAFHAVPRIIEDSLPRFLKANPPFTTDSEAWTMCQEFIQSARVNVNVRQVFFNDEGAEK
jgi:alkylated DNA repair protein alkB family protein 1